MADKTKPGSTAGGAIGYIRDEIPEFAEPLYEGARYEALVPDTLDLQERAALAVNGLTGPTDPEADYEMYFSVRLRSNPPWMRHWFGDMCQSKFMEALPLMRTASGSDLNRQVDAIWMRAILRSQGDDGMAYLPAKGRPWALIGAEDSWLETVATRLHVEQQIIPAHCGRLLSTMILHYKRSGEEVWQNAAEQLVDALIELAVDRGTYAYYAPSCHWAERGSTDDYGRRIPFMGAHVAFVALGLVHAYRETGYEPAVNLAGKLLRYALEELRYVGGDGSFTCGSQVARGRWSHFHMHTYVLLAMLEYARVTGDESLLELANKGYNYGKTQGNVLVGYFPEWLFSEQSKRSELCEVADMVALGIKLSEAGAGDYWDDVDRWIRNMFAEGQLTPIKGEWLTLRADQVPPSMMTARYYTTDRVIDRNVGAFAGWPSANDWGDSIQHCCTANGARAIYYAWENIMHHVGDRLRVNLLLNRASPWADVDSHVPYVGQVDVKVKQALSLSIRIPEWVQPGEVRVRVNGADRPVCWDGRYADVGGVTPGDVATMTFPIAERTEGAWIEKAHYTLVRKGNDVVAIDPPGRFCPLYQREHYRQNDTRWRKVERFVSNEDIYW